MIKRMSFSILLTAAAAGMVAALYVAAFATFRDWNLNPGGLFHNADSTNWAIVAETALSWFVPVFVIAVSGTALILFFVRR